MFLTKEQIHFDLDEIFSDEYEFLTQFTKLKTYFLDIFYCKQNKDKILIERWKFIISSEYIYINFNK